MNFFEYWPKFGFFGYLAQTLDFFHFLPRSWLSWISNHKSWHLILTNNQRTTKVLAKTKMKPGVREVCLYTVKMARAKLPANAGNFTCSSQVKRSLAQFTCVTCSLPVKTGKFTCVEAASTSRRIHANCLQAHVNLTEYHRHFTGNFTRGTHANLPATSMQNCLLLQAKIHATFKQKH